MEAGLAAYAVDVAEVPAKALGFAYAANTGGDRLRPAGDPAADQGPPPLVDAGPVRGDLVGVVGGHRRCPTGVDGWVAVAAIVVGLGLFGLGETLWAPVARRSSTTWRREEMRGRYNALQGMTFTVGSIVGPATAGMLIGHDLPHVWVACVVGGTALAAVAFLSLRRQLTDAQDGLSGPG